MFRRIALARRHLSAAWNSSSNGVGVGDPSTPPTSPSSLPRRLRRALLLRATALVLLCVLYTAAEYNLTEWYFAVYGFVWKPAFPWSWRLLFLLLCAVPAFAFIQLSTLLVFAHRWWRWQGGHNKHAGPSWSQGYVMLPRSESDSLGERELSGAAEDQECDPANVQGDAGPGPTPSVPHRLLSSDWFLQLVCWLAVFAISLAIALHYQHPGDVRYRPSIEHAVAHPNRAGYAHQEKIFIAAMFYNNERIIPYWSDSLVSAIRYLGEDNVFVSILESESKDDSPALLRRLDGRLGAMNVSRRILTQDKAFTKPGDMSWNNRIDFLSELRNRVLEPLVESGGYDKVLFSNDIFIEPETILELLNTADGEYDMACGMDFSRFGLYDLWVLRDKVGRLAGGIWPYFFNAEDHEAMRTESPVPVFTCWNGVVVFRADPVLPVHLRSNRTLSNGPLSFPLPFTHPAAHDPSLLGPNPALTPPVRFRSSAPEECYSSECFLLPYDFRRMFDMQRIFVNPRVIVAYDWRFYKYYKWILRHPVLKWWIEKVYNGAWMQEDVLVVGDPKEVWQWDGGDCHPWTDY